MRTLTLLLHRPNLVVDLNASVPALLDRIAQRGRDYEQGMAPAYLERLNDLYEQWIAGFTLCPILVVETDHLNYVQHESHLSLVAQRVQDRLHGKETLVF